MLCGPWTPGVTSTESLTKFSSLRGSSNPPSSLFVEMQFILAVLCIALIGSVSAYYGVDVSQRTNTNSFSCLVSQGFHFTVVRVYQSSGKCDPNGPATIHDAWAGGMSYVDGYIFPCYSCGNPAKQMDDTINYLASNNVHFAKKGEAVEAGSNSTSVGAKYGMIWLDIEGTQYWSSNAQSNINFLQGMVDEGNKRGVSMGIYSSSSQWSPIMGGTSQFKNLPLWYAHYENTPNPSFSDFKAFGGWSKPNVKQYVGTTSICSASVDKNWYP